MVLVTTLLNYLYRDASNYKAWGAIALNGEVARERWRAALAKLEAGEFFVAEQLGIPPLYEVLYKWSDGPTSADHSWHTFVDIEITDHTARDVYRWGNAEAFVARLLALTGWNARLSRHFRLTT